MALYMDLDLDLIDPKYDTCPCCHPFRILQADDREDDGEDDDVKVWEVVYACLVLLVGMYLPTSRIEWGPIPSCW
jgi:hypothetical protein